MRKLTLALGSLSALALSAYLVRREVMNVWAQGMRVNNNLKPDGQSSAAWMLQFRRQGENISMRWARKRDRYSVVLGLNFKNAGSKEPPRFTIVRSGVTLVERAIKGIVGSIKCIADAHHAPVLVCASMGSWLGPPRCASR